MTDHQLKQRIFPALLFLLAIAATSWHVDITQVMRASSDSVLRRPKPTSQSELRTHAQTLLASIHAPTNVDIPVDYTGEISPMWTCSKQTEFPFSQKLIFVHIFKTAGSSFRAFFDDYAQRCQRGFSLVIHCSQVSAKSMLDSDSPWESNHHKLCINRFSRPRDDAQEIFNVKGNVTGQLLRNTSDILIGHLPLGVHLHWTDYNQNLVQPMYVLFLRDPVAKFVSGYLFVNREFHMTFTEAIKGIKLAVVDDRHEGNYYLGSDKYLTTPSQKGHPRGFEERVELVRSNLLSHNCIVGIVERMGDSLALIQLAVDGDLEVTDQIRRLDTSKVARDNRTDAMTVNKSELSTSAIVAELRKDEVFFQILLEYLKYELLLYDYAIQIHERQVDSLRKRYGDRYFIN